MIVVLATLACASLGVGPVQGEPLTSALAEAASPELAVRRRGFKKLAAIERPSDRHSRALADGLEDPDPVVRETVAAVLRYPRPTHRRALRDKLRRGSPAVRLRAGVLLAMSDRGVHLPRSQWERALAADEPWLRFGAALLAPRVRGDPWRLLAAARDPDPRVRIAALDAFGEMRVTDAGVRANLEKLALDALDRPGEHNVALRTASRLGADALAVFRKALADGIRQGWAIGGLAAAADRESLGAIIAAVRRHPRLTRTFQTTLEFFRITPEDPWARDAVELFRTPGFERDPRALRAIGGLDPRIARGFVQDLVEVLRGDPEIDVWRACVDSLGRIGNAAGAAVPLLLADLELPRYEQYGPCVAQALGGIGAPARSAVGRLCELAASQPGPLRSDTVIAIGEIAAKVGGGFARKVAEQILALAPSPGHRNQTMRVGSALGRIGKPVYPRLIALLSRRNFRNHLLLECAVRSIAKRDRAFVERLLESTVANARLTAAQAIAGLQPAPAAYAPTLLKRLDLLQQNRVNPPISELSAVLEALAATRAFPVASTSKLVDLLCHEQLHWSIFACLRSMPSPPVDHLVEALRLRPDRQLPVLRAIAALGDRARAAIPKIVELAHCKPKLAPSAAKALRALGKQGFEASLELGVTPRSLDQNLDNLTRCHDPELRLLVTKLLARNVVRLRATDDLTRLARDSDRRVRLWALLGLARAPEPSKWVFEVVGEATHDLDPRVRLRALMTFGRLSPPYDRARPVLVDILGDWDPRMRSKAAAQLGRYGRVAADCVPYLEARRGDDDRRVRAAADLALRRIAMH